MTKKKVVVDGSQRTLFSCKNFGASQRPAAVGPSQGCTAEAVPSPARRAANVTENRDNNVLRNSVRRAQPGKQVQELAVEEGDSADLQHATQAMKAAAETHANAPPAAPPQNFAGIAVGKVKDVQAKLNAEQLEAALAPTSPPVFLLAGAGTGKTTTLIARVWHMIAQGIFPRAWLPMFPRSAVVLFYSTHIFMCPLALYIFFKQLG
jgi:UvrD/REP helicase N-terminal domain